MQTGRIRTGFQTNFTITKKTFHLARHQWLTPVIPATQEAEIRRIVVQSQPRTNSLQDPISETKQNKTFTEKGWWSGSRCRP
jgi:hypothetical protein